jgi:alkylhydroperoxidase family enzyme
MIYPKRLLKMPNREDVAREELDDYDLVKQRTEKIDYATYDLPARYYEALMNSPPIAAAIVRIGKLVRAGGLRGSYSDAEREFVDVVMGTDLKYNGIFTIHIPDAIAVGVRPEAILAVRAGTEEKLSEEERQIAEYTRQVISGTVTDESHAAMSARLGKRGALEFTVFISFLLMTIRLWQALGVPNPDDEDIAKLIQGLIDGSVEVPDPKARIA